VNQGIRVILIVDHLLIVNDYVEWLIAELFNCEMVNYLDCSQFYFFVRLNLF